MRRWVLRSAWLALLLACALSAPSANVASAATKPGVALWKRVVVRSAVRLLPAAQARVVTERLVPPRKPAPPTELDQTLERLSGARRALARGRSEHALDLAHEVLWPLHPSGRPDMDPLIQRHALRVAQIAARSVLIPDERGGYPIADVKAQVARAYDTYQSFAARLEDITWHPWNAFYGESARVFEHKVQVALPRLRRVLTAAKGLFPNLEWELYRNEARADTPRSLAVLGSQENWRALLPDDPNL
jgi:hypothetical protein